MKLFLCLLQLNNPDDPGSEEVLRELCQDSLFHLKVFVTQKQPL